MVDIGVLEIVDGKVAVAERLAMNAETLGAPCTCPHEDGLITVAEEIVDADCTADGRVRTDVDAERQEFLGVAVKRRGRQTKVGDAIAQHAADLLHPLEDGHAVAFLCQLDRDDNARRPRPDDGDIVSVVGLAREDELVEIGVRDIVLDA